MENAVVVKTWMVDSFQVIAALPYCTASEACLKPAYQSHLKAELSALQPASR